MEKVLAYAKENQSKHLEELFEFLRIPSVSAQEVHAEDCRRAAEWMANHFEGLGLENVRVFEGEGHPLVRADWLKAGPDKPTLLIYGHYDVQPADPVELWDSDPFEPTLKDGWIYARGANDNKGLLWGLVKAVESWLKTEGALPVNVKFIVEGEEEYGGTVIASYVANPANAEDLKADAVLVSDTMMVAEDVPTITTALRGMVYTEIRVQGPARDLHSGLCGGAVMNPALALSWILSKLKDEHTGRILIPGFYDDVVFEEKDREFLSKVPTDENAWLKEMGTKELWGEEGYTLTERLSARPTLDVNGIWGGYIEPGAKTVIPSLASAKVSTRLVANQNPEEIFNLIRDYVHEVCPPQVSVEVEQIFLADPVSFGVDAPAIQCTAKALKEVFSKEPVFDRVGGSVPVVADFKHHLGLDCVLLGFGLPDDRIHSPNERYKVRQFELSVETVIRTLHHLGAA